MNVDHAVEVSTECTSGVAFVTMNIIIINFVVLEIIAVDLIVIDFPYGFHYCGDDRRCFVSLATVTRIAIDFIAVDSTTVASKALL